VRVQSIDKYTDAVVPRAPARRRMPRNVLCSIGPAHRRPHGEVAQPSPHLRYFLRPIAAALAPQ
jgi:hypothetical protein